MESLQKEESLPEREIFQTYLRSPLQSLPPVEAQVSPEKIQEKVHQDPLDNHQAQNRKWHLIICYPLWDLRETEVPLVWLLFVILLLTFLFCLIQMLHQVLSSSQVKNNNQQDATGNWKPFPWMNCQDSSAHCTPSRTSEARKRRIKGQTGSV